MQAFKLHISNDCTPCTQIKGYVAETGSEHITPENMQCCTLYRCEPEELEKFTQLYRQGPFCFFGRL